MVGVHPWMWRLLELVPTTCGQQRICVRAMGSTGRLGSSSVMEGQHDPRYASPGLHCMRTAANSFGLACQVVYGAYYLARHRQSGRTFSPLLRSHHSTSRRCHE